MNERKIKKQLIRITAIVIASSITMCIAVFIVLFYTLQTAHKADHEQMKTEVMEYENRILKQIDKNLQILTSLSKAYEISGIMESTEELENIIEETNKTNSFISMAYFPINGSGIINSPEYGTRYNFNLEDCAPYAKSAIEKAFQGENCVSKMFDSDIYDEKLFVYCVPVYKNGEISGALAASDTLEIFRDIVSGNTVMGGQGYIHILDSEGSFLVRSDNSLVKENMSSIFDGPYLSEKTKTEAHNAFQNRNSMYGDFEYNGEKCHFYMSPMSINGWYLFCANRLWASTLSIGKVLILTGVFFFAILIAMFFLLYYGYYKFLKTSLLLLQTAYFDPVTQAKNSLKFDQEFYDFKEKNENYSIVTINIHSFKSINDLFGINEGNKVLCYIKKVIEEHLKKDEFFCRDSADLFYILFSETDEQVLKKRVKEIIQTVSKETSNAEYSYEISLYSGLSIRGSREKALLALQSIKQRHNINIAFYNDELQEKMRNRNNIESRMHLALKNNEFKLFLQSKHDLKTDRLTGAEALVRWQTPDGSYRYPNEFISLFESNGFCTKLDMYMLEQVCKQIRIWMDDGKEPIPISINQSKILFFNRNYPEELTKVVNHYQIPHSLIILEILEGIATNDTEQINNQIEALHTRGFKVSMDDFGSGYSSLNMLYRLKIDELKLDRAFLYNNGIQTNDERRTIILKQIINFARQLGIATVAEGIETKQDRDYMAEMACDFGQGYYYEKPLSASEFSKKYMDRPKETP